MPIAAVNVKRNFAPSVEKAIAPKSVTNHKPVNDEMSGIDEWDQERLGRTIAEIAQIRRERCRRWRRFDPHIFVGPLLAMVADPIADTLGVMYPTPPILVAVTAAGCIDGARGAWLAALVGLVIEHYDPPPGPPWCYQVYPLLIAVCFSLCAAYGRDRDDSALPTAAEPTADKVLDG